MKRNTNEEIYTYVQKRFKKLGNDNSKFAVGYREGLLQLLEHRKIIRRKR